MLQIGNSDSEIAAINFSHCRLEITASTAENAKMFHIYPKALNGKDPTKINEISNNFHISFPITLLQYTADLYITHLP